MVFQLLRKRPKEQSATPRCEVFADLCEQVLPVLAQHVDASRPASVLDDGRGS